MIPHRPVAAFAKYNWVIAGMAYRTARPDSAMPSSSHAYTRKGCRADEMRRGSARLPRHMPPMNVPNNTASETAEEPTTN